MDQMKYQGEAIEVIRGRSIITKTYINHQPVIFLQTHFRDVIQNEHRNGRFYEPEELEIIGRYFNEGDVFCDIGTNVGNHSLFVGLFLKPSKIICFEPNQEIIPTLRSNIMLNNLEGICDLSHLGLGVGHENLDDLEIDFGPRNVGAGRLRAGEGNISVRSGDSMLKDQPVNFVKIDVEGMELDVLAGLSITIEKNQPNVFIECENHNVDDVTNWFDNLNYERVEEWRRYPQNINFLFAPRGKAA